MKTRHITGKLYPSYAKTYDLTHMARFLHEAMKKNHLTNVFHQPDFHHSSMGIMEIDKIYGSFLDEQINKTLNTDAQTLSAAIAKFIHEDGVRDLEFQGELTVTANDTDNEEVTIIKITVYEGKVSYKQGTFTWSEKVTV